MSEPRRIVVALAGNPNTGKTTIFNALTGSRAKVGNYPGVTVDRRIGEHRIPGLGTIELIDVPGTYSLLARSAEEQIALDGVAGIAGEPHPDCVVMCVDSTQLVRSLYLTMQVQELGSRVVVALTMVDEAGDAAPDAGALARVLGCPVVPVIARKRQGLAALEQAIAKVVAEPEPGPRWRWTPSDELAAHLEAVRPSLPAEWPRSDAIALWALMSLDDDDELIGIAPSLREAVRARGADPRRVDDEVIEARYRWLDREVAPLARRPVDRSRTQRVDRVLLNRVGGFVIFLAIMFVIFQSLFAWSEPAIALVESAFAWTGAQVRELLPAGLFADFVVDALIAGVGSVMVFLPQILLLFFFIGLMEDCGYMARVAYLMDRIMRTMGLHGRAFVPMMSGFACAVPAILSTRTMERRRDRLLTMMVVPLMTCSARLPVYTLVIAALYPDIEVWGFLPVGGLLMVGMYLFSTVTALTAAWVLSKTVKPLRAKRLPFVIELPPYRLPRLRDVVRMMWERSAFFLKEAGTVILACTVVLWALLSFPRELPEGSPDYDAMIAQATDDDARGALENEKAGELLRNSYAGRLGHAIEPGIEPLGFDWKIGVGLIGAFAAREVFVSTMGVVYSVGDEVDEDDPTLRAKIREERHADGTPVYTPLVGLSLMIFFALACQCMSTLAVVKRETGGYRWPLFLFTYMTALAWVMSFVVFQVGSLLGFG